MTAIATAALLIAIAAWGKPRAPSRTAHSPTRARRQQRAPKQPTVDEWAALLDAVSAEVRTGSSLGAAVEFACVARQPHGQLVTPSATLAAIGADATSSDADEAVVLHAIRAAHAIGGPIAATIDTASALLRERAVIRGEALAHSAQARLSARVLTGVPLAFAAWSMASSATFRAAFLSPVGLASAAAGGVCNLLGWWWMRRIVARAAT